MTKLYVYLTRRIGAEGDAARDVAAIVIGQSHAEAATIAGKHHRDILGGLFDGQSLFEVINLSEPTVEEAKQAYLDAVARYRAEVNPTDEELGAAEETLLAFEEEQKGRRRDPTGVTDALDYEEQVLNYIDEHRGEEEEAASA